MAPRLSPYASRALLMIGSHPRGAIEKLLIMFSGFKREMLAELVFAGLVRVVTETAPTGTSVIKIERYRITDDGRKAIKG
jgi:hypothetical protein